MLAGGGGGVPAAVAIPFRCGGGCEFQSAPPPPTNPTGESHPVCFALALPLSI